jgi:hypothetical protein
MAVLLADVTDLATKARAAMSVLVERFETIAAVSERGKRRPGGLLYDFRSLPIVFG